MFDPQKILQQVLGGGGDSGDQENRKRGISADTLKGATIGGLAGLLLGSKRRPQDCWLGAADGRCRGSGRPRLKAWQNWQAQQNWANSPRPTGRRQDRIENAEGTVFLPKDGAERDELSLTLLSAMISAAKSDGHIDAARTGAYLCERLSDARSVG